MTINIAFKSPDAVVFATDGLASVFEMDEDGREIFVSNMAEVEKLVVLEKPPALAMFNGVGSFAGAAIAAELRQVASFVADGRGPDTWADAIAVGLWNRARQACGIPPTPLHVILARFDAEPGQGEPGKPARPGRPGRRGKAETSAPPPPKPLLYEIKWPQGLPPSAAAPRAAPVLVAKMNGKPESLYGAYYAGATAAVSRFVEGFDPELQQSLAVVLAGPSDRSRPGVLEELVKLVQAQVGAGRPLPRAELDALVTRFARRILRSAFPEDAPRQLAEHFSLQAAIDYVVFLAQCAYARENLSPTRHGPPRVGSTLQVACLQRGEAPMQLARIELDVRLQGNVRAMEVHR